MYASASFIGLALLSIVGAISTVTVSINTGECPATYSSSLASSSSGTATSSISPVLASSSMLSGSSSDVGSTSTTSTYSESAQPSMASSTGTSSGAATTMTAAPCPCPQYSNQTVDDSLGYDYDVMCDESFSLLQGPGSSFAATFDDCMLACDAYVDQTTYNACTGASYLPGDPENGLNCFLTTDSDPAMTPETGACIAMVPAGEQ